MTDTPEVWVVSSQDGYDDKELRAVCTSKAKAEEIAKPLHLHGGSHVRVERWTVDALDAELEGWAV